MALDPRIVQVSIEIDGVLRTFKDIRIEAKGTKFANSLQNEAVITLTNLNKHDRDYLLTETSPYNLNRTPKLVTLEAGRQSWGTKIIFLGNVIMSSVTQPPDVGISLRCLTGNFQKGNILARNQSAVVQLSQLSQQVANDLDLTLKYDVTNPELRNKDISNYAFTGAALNQIEVMGAIGGINVFIDNKTLVVKDAFTPITGSTRIVSKETGMVGIPEFTEQGIRVVYLVDKQTVLGGGLDVRSDVYPTTNAIYTIYKLGFHITNRDTPFYYIAEAARQPDREETSG